MGNDIDHALPILTDGELVVRLVEGTETPKQLAESCGLSLDELAHRGTSPGCQGTLRRLARLADLRTLMLVSNYRASAAIKLIQIATSGEGDELSRKACVNLLELRLPGIDASADSNEEGSMARTVLAPEAEAAVQRLFHGISQAHLPSAA